MPVMSAVPAVAAPAAADVKVVGRTEWVDRNLASFRHLLEPAERRIAERLEASGSLGAATASLAHQVVSAETALLLGFLSRRVLGQYELVLLDATGHCPNLSAPEATTEAIEGFLRRLRR